MPVLESDFVSLFFLKTTGQSLYIYFEELAFTWSCPGWVSQESRVGVGRGEVWGARGAARGAARATSRNWQMSKHKGRGPGVSPSSCSLLGTRLPPGKEGHCPQVSVLVCSLPTPKLHARSHVPASVSPAVKSSQRLSPSGDESHRHMVGPVWDHGACSLSHTVLISLRSQVTWAPATLAPQHARPKALVPVTTAWTAPGAQDCAHTGSRGPASCSHSAPQPRPPGLHFSQRPELGLRCIRYQAPLLWGPSRARAGPAACTSLRLLHPHKPGLRAGEGDQKASLARCPRSPRSPGATPDLCPPLPPSAWEATSFSDGSPSPASGGDASTFPTSAKESLMSLGAEKLPLVSPQSPSMVL